MQQRLAGLKKAFSGRAAPMTALAFLASQLLAMATLPSYDSAREWALDSILALARPPAVDDAIVIVDIDRRMLEQTGPWPWSRESLAALVSRIAAAEPRAIGLDILIEGSDERSPAALARRLSTGAVSPELRSRLEAEMPGMINGDERLRQALAQRPVVMGLAIDPERSSPASAPAPVLTEGRVDLRGLWRAAGIVAPRRELAGAAAGAGVLATLDGSDGRVRHVPLFVEVDGLLWPGFALEIVRVAQGASTYVVSASSGLRVGGIELPLPQDAILRLDPIVQSQLARSTLSAADVMTGPAAERLRNRIVLIGSSAPELGGLRTASFGELLPSVQLQAAALSQLMAQRVPVRPVWLALAEMAACLAAGILALTAAGLWPPLRAGAVALVLSVGWLVAATISSAIGQLLLDPIGVPLSAVGSFALAALFTAAATRRRADALRRRFEQHLSPELVRRIVQNPDLLKLTGEEREVTILFTDIEGFTSMTERAEPAALIHALDRYLEGMTAIVVSHGGMVEKIVGDGLHALFNAPLDLPNHPSRAVACAEALLAFSEAFRTESDVIELRFGRTRFGIETGRVIVGDVGGRLRLDYTAYGDAMNMASRLEAANKELGTSICIGETTAMRLGGSAGLRPLGLITIRGRGRPIEVYEPWPADMMPAERTQYLAALQAVEVNPEWATRTLRELAASRTQDSVLKQLVARLATSCSLRSVGTMGTVE